MCLYCALLSFKALGLCTIYVFISSVSRCTNHFFHVFHQNARILEGGGTSKSARGRKSESPGACGAQGCVFYGFWAPFGVPGEALLEAFSQLFVSRRSWGAIGRDSESDFSGNDFSRFRSEFFTNPRPPGGARCAFGLGRRGPNALRPFCSALRKKSRKVNRGPPFGGLFRRLWGSFRHR